jgi:hypothetical protein
VKLSVRNDCDFVVREECCFQAGPDWGLGTTAARNRDNKKLSHRSRRLKL